MQIIMKNYLFKITSCINTSTLTWFLDLKRALNWIKKAVLVIEEITKHFVSHYTSKMYFNINYFYKFYRFFHMCILQLYSKWWPEGLRSNTLIWKVLEEMMTHLISWQSSNKCFDGSWLGLIFYTERQQALWTENVCGFLD